MPFHDDLLACAQSMIPPHLAAPHPPPPHAAQLRRGVSTAYYALFHLLVHETMATIIADAALADELSRSINHEPTKGVCKEYASARALPGGLTLATGEVIPPQLQSIGLAFVSMIDARHRADYDPRATKDFTHAEAYTYLMTVEDAFLDWVAIQADPATPKLLLKIFQASLNRRKV
jgi:hypothetical protein